jgi:hypothetical protein
MNLRRSRLAILVHFLRLRRSSFNLDCLGVQVIKALCELPIAALLALHLFLRRFSS